MDKKIIFPWQVKLGSYKILWEILQFPQTTGPEIDGAICRVTYSNYAVDLTLKHQYVEQYKNQNVMQVRLLSNDDLEFIVMSEMLDHLSEPVVKS